MKQMLDNPRYERMVLAWINDLLNFLAAVGEDIEPLKVALVFIKEAEVNSRMA